MLQSSILKDLPTRPSIVSVQRTLISHAPGGNRLVGLLLLLLVHFFAAAQEYNWAFQLGRSSSYDCLAGGLAVDSSNNVLLCGSTYCPTDVDPSADLLNLTSVGTGYNTGFLAKYDQDMNLLWAFNLNGPGGTLNHENCIHDVAVDSSGGIYVTLTTFPGIGNNVDYDPGPDVMLGPIGDVLAKYSANGEFLWATSIQSSLQPLSDAPHLHINGLGQIYVYDSYTYGDRVYEYDMNGILLNTYSLGPSSGINIRELMTDSIGNLVLVGTYEDEIDLDLNSGTMIEVSPPGNGASMFIAKYDSNKNLVNYKVAHSQEDIVIKNLFYDESGDIYLQGQFRDSVDFDLESSSGAYGSNAFNHYFTFCVKYTSELDYDWSFAIGPNAFGNMRMTPSGYLMLGGKVNSNNIDFDPAPNVVTLPFGTQAYLAYYSQNGALIQLEPVGSSFPPAIGSDLRFGQNQDFYVCGGFDGDLHVDNENTTVLTSSDSQLFLARYSYSAPVGRIEESDRNDLTLTVSPNPSISGKLVLSSGLFTHFREVLIQDAQGRTVFSKSIDEVGVCELSTDLANGRYLVTAFTKSQDVLRQQVIIQR